MRRVDPEQERGEKIVRQMQRLGRKSRPRPYNLAPLLLAVALIAVIVAVILLNRERFALAWGHLTRPDSIPGVSR
jgi:hypothetical protein